MNFIFFTFFSLLFSLPLQATESGYYVEEQMINSAEGAPDDTTYFQMWVCGDKFRRHHGGPDEITIGRLDLNCFWIISLKDKTYCQIDLAQMQQMASLTIMMMGAQMNDEGSLEVPDDLYVKTGKKKKINAWNAEEVALNPRYAGQGLIQEFSMWISKDAPAPSNLYSIMMRNVFGNPSGEGKKLLDIWEKFGGYPVLIQVDLLGMTNTILTTKIEAREIDPELFNLPSGLEQIEFPPMEQFKQMNNH